MINITRSKCPNVLIKAPKYGNKYRNKKVVIELWKMQLKKCCYCETYIPEEGHRKAVEHFYPKSIFKGKRNDWNNLLLVCPQCNGKKSNHFPIMLTNKEEETKAIYLTKPKPGKPAIINPSDNSDNPEDHLTYNYDRRGRLVLYGQILPKDNSFKGDNTINITGIGEPFIHRIRKNYMLKIIEPAYLNLLTALESGSDLQLQNVINTYENLMRGQSEFAGMARDFAKTNDFETEFPPLKIPI